MVTYHGTVVEAPRTGELKFGEWVPFHERCRGKSYERSSRYRRSRSCNFGKALGFANCRTGYSKS